MEGESLKYIKYEKYYTYTKCQFSREPGNGESRVAYSYLYYKYQLRYQHKRKTKFFLEHPVCIFQIETLRLMYNWFNRFCVGWSRLFSDHNNEGGGNTDMLPCILARKPVVRTLRVAARPGKIRTFNWPAVWCAGGNNINHSCMQMLCISLRCFCT